MNKKYQLQFNKIQYKIHIRILIIPSFKELFRGWEFGKPCPHHCYVSGKKFYFLSHKNHVPNVWKILQKWSKFLYSIFIFLRFNSQLGGYLSEEFLVFLHNHFYSKYVFLWPTKVYRNYGQAFIMISSPPCYVTLFILSSLFC